MAGDLQKKQRARTKQPRQAKKQSATRKFPERTWCEGNFGPISLLHSNDASELDQICEHPDCFHTGIVGGCMACPTMQHAGEGPQPTGKQTTFVGAMQLWPLEERQASGQGRGTSRHHPFPLGPNGLGAQ